MDNDWKFDNEDIYILFSAFGLEKDAAAILKREDAWIGMSWADFRDMAENHPLFPFEPLLIEELAPSVHNGIWACPGEGALLIASGLKDRLTVAQVHLQRRTREMDGYQTSGSVSLYKTVGGGVHYAIDIKAGIFISLVEACILGAPVIPWENCLTNWRHFVAKGMGLVPVPIAGETFDKVFGSAPESIREIFTVLREG